MATQPLVLGLTTFVAGALFGFAASALAHVAPPEPVVARPLQEAASPHGASDAQLLAQLRELVDALQANTEALRESPRRAVTSDADAEARVERQLQSLQAGATNSSPSTASHESGRRERVPTGAPTLDIRALAWIDRAIPFEDHIRTSSHDHLLWSYEDVIEAYGKPDRQHVDEKGVRWGYDRIPHLDKTRTYNFVFVDGLVVDVQ